MISLGPPMYLEHRLQRQDSVTSLSQISNFTANDFINKFHFNKNRLPRRVGDYYLL